MTAKKTAKATKKPVRKTPAKKKPAAKKAGGRPSSYKPEYVKQAAKLCALGATNVELADFFGVSIKTVENWMVQHAEFLRALKESKKTADERVVRSLYQRAVGYTHDAVKIFMPTGAREPIIVPHRVHVPPDTTAGIFWLKNRDQANWRDKAQVEHIADETFAALLKERRERARAATKGK